VLSVVEPTQASLSEALISDKKLLLGIPPEEVAVSVDNIESEPTGDSRSPSMDSASEDVSPRPSSNAANSLTPSTATTARQQRLQEQEQARASQLGSLEARTGSAEWYHVSRAEYDATAAEMRRLRAEVSWFRDAQQSDWTLGLSDEMPLPYSNEKIDPRE
jgi:hypothetical protein